MKYIAPKSRMPIISAALTHLRLKRTEVSYVPYHRDVGKEYPNFDVYIHKPLAELPGVGMQDLILACAMLNPGPDAVYIHSTDPNEIITVPCQTTKIQRDNPQWTPKHQTG